MPAAQGRYFFGDNCANRIQSAPPAGGTRCATSRSRSTAWLGFGEDARGELYLASVQSGNVYRLAG